MCVWEAAESDMALDALNCSGCSGTVHSGFAQVTAKGSEKEKKGKVKGGEVSSFMSEQCQAGEERGMM